MNRSRVIMGLTLIGRRNHVLDGVHTGAIWQVRSIDLCDGGYAACRWQYFRNLFNCSFGELYKYRLVVMSARHTFTSVV